MPTRQSTVNQSLWYDHTIISMMGRDGSARVARGSGPVPTCTARLRVARGQHIEVLAILVDVTHHRVLGCGAGPGKRRGQHALP